MGDKKFPESANVNGYQIDFMQPRITISALKGGSGKTIVSLGLASVWKEEGRRVAPFKKGPDFIDSGWLHFAAGRKCYNLDPFLMTHEQILQSFISRSTGSNISIIEGNRGLFDGLDVDGCCSTAELARLLETPVLLILDVSMTTRTIAAVVKGCQTFDPELNIAGVILNRVAGSRQENLISGAIDKYCDLPVVGSIPKLRDNPFPERHMGLVPHQERAHAEKAVSWAGKVAREHLDLSRIVKIAFAAGSVPKPPEIKETNPVFTRISDRPRIGFIRDSAFWFYYPENLEQLGNLGADLVLIDATADKKLPEIDALYIGGGFPETRAELLSENREFRNSLKEKIEQGLPVYAECGGFMYLGEKLLLNDRSYPMVGALPVEFILHKKPKGHGYTILEVKNQNPYYPVNTVLKGHEFHYSEPIITSSRSVDFAFRVNRGHGIDKTVDGMIKNNVLATYTHIHAAGNPDWARSMARIAAKYRKGSKA